MKTVVNFLLLLLLCSLSGCNGDDNNNSNPVDQLPPATQTGAGTFACLVNGKPFIDTGGGYFNCFYQFLDGGYYFGIQGRDDKTQMRTVILGTTNKEITEGEKLELLDNRNGNAWAGGRFNLSGTFGEGSYTNTQYTGELEITRFDFQNGIVSGTFWFSIEHPKSGETVLVTEGRFDTLFTQ